LNLLSSKHVAVIGCGSGGGALAHMLAKDGVEMFTLVDADKVEAANLKRHVLDRDYVGQPKVVAMKGHLRKINERVRVSALSEKFNGLPEKPDIICGCTDSLACDSLINAYAVQNGVPAVFGGVHGDAHTVEIITYVPAEGPCFECWEREGELPQPTQEKYTNPDYDSTKMPSQQGLWGDVLMAASLQFQAVLGILGSREKFPPLVLKSLRYPFKLETYDQGERCAVCSSDFSRLTA